MYETSFETTSKGYFFETSFSNKLHLHFKKTNTYYTWKRVNSYIYGILLGKLWISNEGETIITNHKTKETCLCRYYPPSSLFPNKQSRSLFHNKDPINRVEAIVRDSKQMAHYVVEGISSTHLDYAKVLRSKKVESIRDLKKLSIDKRKPLWENR